MGYTRRMAKHTETCETCQGSGRQEWTEYDANGNVDRAESGSAVCDDCHGAGGWDAPLAEVPTYTRPATSAWAKGGRLNP